MHQLQSYRNYWNGSSNQSPSISNSNDQKLFGSTKPTPLSFSPCQSVSVSQNGQLTGGNQRGGGFSRFVVLLQATCFNLSRTSATSTTSGQNNMRFNSQFGATTSASIITNPKREDSIRGRYNNNPTTMPVNIERNNEDPTLRVITMNLKRVRGLSIQMNRFSRFPILIEIFGTCTAVGEEFTQLPGFQFVLQEVSTPQSRRGSSGVTLNCVIYDFDDIKPPVECGVVYRCVGKYHPEDRVFQCFTIEPSDNETVKILETFQFCSDDEVSRIIHSQNEAVHSRFNGRIVRKVTFSGLDSRRANGSGWTRNDGSTPSSWSSK